MSAFRRTRDTLAIVALVAAALAVAGAAAVPEPAPHLRLSDREFWSLVTDLSEPGGTFVTENIVSNEIAFQDVLPELQRRPRQGAYIGVAPEQNLTYVAALRPPIAFIVDLQRANLDLHLMYKALVELSDDRADFLSRLFARPRLPRVRAASSAAELFDAYVAEPRSEDLASTTLDAVVDRLTRVHRFALTRADIDGIGRMYRGLSRGGPNLRGDFGRDVSIPAWVPSFAEMLSQADPGGRNQSFLGSDATFATLKRYELDNAIVPVVGNFAGDKALRAVGDYLRSRRLTVGTFYASNVEQYLFTGDAWPRFCRNLVSLPLDDDAMLVRTYFTSGIEGMREYVDPLRPMLDAVAAGKVATYDDVILRSRVPRP